MIWFLVAISMVCFATWSITNSKKYSKNKKKQQVKMIWMSSATIFVVLFVIDQIIG